MKEDQEFNVYDEESREELEESDEIDPQEEAFMQGYDKDEEETFLKEKRKKEKKE